MNRIGYAIAILAVSAFGVQQLQIYRLQHPASHAEWLGDIVRQTDSTQTFIPMEITFPCGPTKPMDNGIFFTNPQGHIKLDIDMESRLMMVRSADYSECQKVSK